jgi:hypothetical protein
VSEGFFKTLLQTQKHNPSLTQRVGIVANAQLQKAPDGYKSQRLDGNLRNHERRAQNAATQRPELPVAGHFSNLSHGRAIFSHFAPIPQTSESIAKNTGFSGV